MRGTNSLPCTLDAVTVWLAASFNTLSLQHTPSHIEPQCYAMLWHNVLSTFEIQTCVSHLAVPAFAEQELRSGEPSVDSGLDVDISAHELSLTLSHSFYFLRVSSISALTMEPMPPASSTPVHVLSARVLVSVTPGECLAAMLHTPTGCSACVDMVSILYHKHWLCHLDRDSTVFSYHPFYLNFVHVFSSCMQKSICVEYD